MKKFLLSCFIALGITSSAQYSYLGDFENPGFNTTTYKQFGGGTQQAAAACNGGFGGRITTTASVTQSGYMIDMSTLGQTNNGQKIDFSVSYKKGATVAGTLQLAWFKYDSVRALWTINYVGSPVTLAAAALTTCTTINASLPAGTVQPGDIAGVGAFFVRSGTANGSIYFDDINLTQDTSVTTAPACTTITAPADLSTISAGTATMKWNAASTAVNYKVKVGTTLGGSDVYNGTVAGTILNLSLAKSTMYYAIVVPSNLNGDATGCTGISFTTDTNIAYCGGIISTAPTATYPISSVTLNGVTNTSAATVGSPAYEDYTSTVFNVTAGSTYNLNVTGTGLGTNIFAMTAFIDWNGDGDFNDADEKYFQGPFQTGTSTPINFVGSITVPPGATAGTKRMRIKYNFQGSSTTVLQPALADPCSNMTNGQVEDYSILVAPVTTAPLCTSFTAPLDMSTTFPANGTMTWTPAANASGYKVYIGTSMGGTDIANGVLVSGTNYSPALTSGTKYYAKVVPTNSVGDATSCSEISFTAANVIYCSAGATNISATFEKISNVAIGTINNPSTAGDGYEDFTSVAPTILKRESVYPITVDISNFDGSGDDTMVWIDYNQDGVFDDATEKTMLTSTASATGSITIPPAAKLGNTRMRVRMHYNGVGPNATSCGTSTYGQVEDYTVNIDVKLATSAVTKTAVSVYPNPFKDVLKISDVKGVQSISISDVSGRQVKMMKPSTELQVSDLKTGLYIVNLHMEDGTVKSIKAIKK